MMNILGHMINLQLILKKEVEVFLIKFLENFFIGKNLLIKIKKYIH